MTLYRNDTTGFLGDFLTGAPGAGWTLIPDMPGAPLTDVVNWWRDVDKGDLISDWHPSLQGGNEVPRPRGLAGSGVNIFPPRYSNWEGELLPPIVTTGCTVQRVSPGFNGEYALRIIASEDNAECWLTPSLSEYNIKVTPNLRWILSGYFSSPKESMTFTALVNLTDVYGSNLINLEKSITTGATAHTFSRAWGSLQLAAYNGVGGQVGLRLAHAGDILDVDAAMLEEWIGDVLQPSAYFCPPVITDGEQVVKDTLSWSKSATVTVWQTLAPSLLPYTLWAPTVPEARIRGKLVLRGVTEIHRNDTTGTATLIATLKRAGVTVREVRLTAMPGQEYLQVVIEHVDETGDTAAIPFTFSLNCPEETIEWRGTGVITETKR